ncbi:MAG: hypothetical protein H7A35_15135 [Planctomycetales bacterium]|nr:MAG: hypothetical protein H7A35_15135 [Planctomycetales bacterium]
MRDLQNDRQHLPDTLAVVNEASSFSGETASFRYQAVFRDEKTPAEFLWDFWAKDDKGGTLERYSTAKEPEMVLAHVDSKEEFSGTLRIRQGSGDSPPEQTYEFTYEVLPFSFSLGEISWDSDSYGRPVAFSVELEPSGHSEKDYKFEWTIREGESPEGPIFRTSKLANPVVTFLDTSKQSYMVNVSVTPIALPDNTNYQSNFLQLIPESPVPLSVSPQAGKAGSEVQFSLELQDTADPSIYGYEWDFGNIGTSDEPGAAKPLVQLGGASDLLLPGSVRVFTLNHAEETAVRHDFTFRVNPDLQIDGLEYGLDGSNLQPLQDFELQGRVGQILRLVPMVSDGAGIPIPLEQLEFSWTLGNGVSPESSQASEPLVSLVKPGKFPVSLGVSFAGEQGADPASYEFFVDILPGQSEFKLGEVLGTSGLENNASTLTIEILDSETGLSYPDLQNLTYSWNFKTGEGPSAATPATSSAAGPTVILGSASQSPYICSVEVSDPLQSGLKQSKVFALTITAEPSDEPDFSLGAVTGALGTEGSEATLGVSVLTLDGAGPYADPARLSYLWNFQDGETAAATPTTSALRVPTIVLGKSRAVPYTCSVTVSDPLIEDSESILYFSLQIDPAENLIQLAPIAGIEIGTNEQFEIKAVLIGSPPPDVIYEWNIPEAFFPGSENGGSRTATATQVGRWSDLSVTAYQASNPANTDTAEYSIDVMSMEVLAVSPTLVAPDAVGVKFSFAMKHGIPTTWLWDFGTLGTTSDSSLQSPTVDITAPSGSNVTITLYLDNPYEEFAAHEFKVNVL